MLTSKNSIELLQGIESENLVAKLIMQLNKDFYLANISEKFEQSVSINNLKSNLVRIIKTLLTTSYDDYLNLMYRIDISEKELLKIKYNEIDKIVEQIVFLILKREYQKVWFKSKI